MIIEIQTHKAQFEQFSSFLV